MERMTLCKQLPETFEQRRSVSIPGALTNIGQPNER
jgi:hypothetical protein